MKAAYQKLIEWADTDYTDRDPDYIDKWLAKEVDIFIAVDELAIFLARSYSEGNISFDIASTIFNQTMPVIDFNKSAEAFWIFYLAFEDFEHLDEPEDLARSRIKEELSAMNAI
jgi:hypothetical protein